MTAFSVFFDCCFYCVFNDIVGFIFTYVFSIYLYSCNILNKFYFIVGLIIPKITDLDLVQKYSFNFYLFAFILS